MTATIARRLAIPAVLTALLALWALPAHGADRAAARAGANWLSGAVKPTAPADGGTADTLIALRAAGRLPAAEAARRAATLRAGARSYATTAGGAAKIVMALVASGSGNPRCAAGRLDLLTRIKSYGRSGRYGRTSYDQTLSMLALTSLGVRAPESAVTFLLRAKGSGGWGFTLSGARRDDVSSTSLAIMALRAAGVPASNKTLRAGLRWIRSQRSPTGGFAEERKDRTEANSTARALQAAYAMGSRDTRAERALETLQRGSGAVQFSRTDPGNAILATVEAVPALAGKVLPVARVSRTPGGC